MTVLDTAFEQEVMFRLRLLRAAAAAKMLGISETTLRRWTARGDVKAVRTPGKGLRWRLEDLIAATSEAGPRGKEVGDGSATT